MPAQRRGWTQAELALRVGAEQSTIAKIEASKIVQRRCHPAALRLLGPAARAGWRWSASGRLGLRGRSGAGDERMAATARRRRTRTETETAAAPEREGCERLDRDYECSPPSSCASAASAAPSRRSCSTGRSATSTSELEAQKAATGKVRALILKGRQQGCSTYVGGRFYHRATSQRGLKVFILTHEEQATKNLFEMVERFHEHCAERPSTGVANASELYFDALDSGYKVGTAGTRGVGRSATLQLFHGSEVAFWPHAESHAAGVLQAVADAAGTEVILESTANGVGNLFHRMWRDAESGAGDYVAIFVPWYWQEEYRKPLPEDFVLSAEEHDYAALYRLDHEQMAWRRAKIVELKDAVPVQAGIPGERRRGVPDERARQLHPAGADRQARKAQCEPSGPLVIGYDPAWTGGDRHAMAWRRGRCLIKVECRHGLDTVAAAGWAKRVIDTDQPAKMFIDVGGVGAGVYDQLHHMGAPYAGIVEAVNFGSAPFERAAARSARPASRAGRSTAAPRCG